MLKTILTRKQQAEWLRLAGANRTLVHRWNARNMGFSRILNGAGISLATANGCGYDRRGAALGQAMMELFPAEIHAPAKRHCVGRRRDYKQPKLAGLYGLFYDATRDRARVDGGCGFRAMENILAAIGFSLVAVGGDSGARTTGSEHFILEPVARQQLEWIR